MHIPDSPVYNNAAYALLDAAPCRKFAPHGSAPLACLNHDYVALARNVYCLHNLRPVAVYRFYGDSPARHAITFLHGRYAAHRPSVVHGIAYVARRNFRKRLFQFFTAILFEKRSLHRSAALHRSLYSPCCLCHILRLYYRPPDNHDARTVFDCNMRRLAVYPAGNRHRQAAFFRNFLHRIERLDSGHLLVYGDVDTDIISAHFFRLRRPFRRVFHADQIDQRSSPVLMG